jgi:double-stranded uracil-DNA glycosylase
MARLRGLPAVADRRATALILGSFPGRQSLDAGQYYAHPRNLFWPLMIEFLGLDRSASYRERTRALCENGIALWDVIESCQRSGSLDSRIVTASVRPNDFAAFLGDHPRLRRIYFNGALAEKTFLRFIDWPVESPRVSLRRLPSTSPANASIPYERKFEAWSELKPAAR